MKGTIENRDVFLKNIARKLRREPLKNVPAPKWAHEPQWDVYKEYTKDQLVAVMKEASQSIHTKVYETDSGHLADVVNGAIDDYGGGSVVTTRDPRFAELGLDGVLAKHRAYTWNASDGRKNIDIAAKADIGVTVCDVMLAESATAGLFNDKDKARCVSLLPVTSIVIVPKSVIVPRITQAMEMVEKKARAGEAISTYINFISGPSNSADIEMRLVVGVHGPVKVAYIVVSDR
ncbi:lactate utilization protein C [Sporolactobacillus sp. THM7-7]|nr:lactate utilization protein C [Sporolactobacillus sp. THM7-7]